MMTSRIAQGVGANLLGQHSTERNQEATVYVRNLDPQVSSIFLAFSRTYTLFVSVNVYVPKDRVTNLQQSYGFVEFRREEDADYAVKVLNMIKLGGHLINVKKDVDEKLLYDTFSAFGVIVSNPKIMRDPETGNPRGFGFGFISYDSFDASDAAIEAMTGQYLCNRQITVSYAYKKDTKGERHGTPAQRLLAATNPSSRPHKLYASGPATRPNAPQANGLQRPFANGGIRPVPIPAQRPPPPQAYQNQPQQQHGLAVPPPMELRPPQLIHHQQGFGGPMPPPPHQATPQHMQQGGPPPPPPMHHHHQMSMPPPPPPHQG
ncbi:hypothetical protein EUTSA_v10023032mg [Eutrema salsugineum]|uniref:Splicing factor 3B subunit 4 n=1 Tax=Eutrema salsugineum TaxID=72664 RepID=V4M336_EUTSA|nr:hypothetical protein EUTSA_v10023032mg [Eutrema salsugineum]